ncbi:MAG: hypothetical protein AB7F86_04175 [Bdellovibrionales bacterium]
MIASFLTLLPLMVTLAILAVGFSTIVYKRLRAQSACVAQTLTLQENLRKTLKELLRLNRPATQLRRARQAADEAARNALISGYAPAIAATRAVQAAVIAQQMVFRAKQLGILAQASKQRLEAQRDLTHQMAKIDGSVLQSKVYYWRALAVEPIPATSLTPDYQAAPQFESLQQHEFSFSINLEPSFLRRFNLPGLRQNIQCSITLTERGNQWPIRVLKASAL